MEKLLFSEFVSEGQNFYMADLILPQNERTIPHFHNYYEFQIVLQGGFYEYWNHETLSETEKCSHLIRPEDIHSLKGMTKKNILRNIAVHPVIMEQALHMFALDAKNISSTFSLDETALILFREKTDMLSHMSDETQKNAVFVNVLYDFLYCFVAMEDVEPDVPGWLRILKKEMEKEENYMIGTERMADLSGRSREHISRCFQRYYHTTPSAFVNRCRLQKACSLLISERDSIIDIALESGFENLSYFHRLFRAAFGMSASEYRKKSHRLFSQ